MAWVGETPPRRRDVLFGIAIFLALPVLLLSSILVMLAFAAPWRAVLPSPWAGLAGGVTLGLMIPLLRRVARRLRR